MPPTENLPLAQVLSQTASLYSPPEVALEVLRLAEAPEVDLRALRDCLQRDPALAAKLLRVVNSSLYGLSGEVRDLNQALALLGVLPLKMLVLGFSLPDAMFAGLVGPTVERYWTDTVTRATAARLISEIGWDRGGDEALVAGLMQGIGQLVLLQQFGAEYGELVESSVQATAASTTLAEREFEALGFEHRTLSAELMRQWGLPVSLAEAIALQTTPEKLRNASVATKVPLARPLRLADLLTQLVAHRRLSVLPALVEEGEAYCGLTRRQINSLVEELQPQVDQLAEAMSVELTSGRDYQAVLLEAHAQLTIAAEQGAGLLFGSYVPPEGRSEDDALCDRLLAETEQLSRSVQEFMAQRTVGDEQRLEATAAHAGRSQPRRPHGMPLQGISRLAEEVRGVAASCRQVRAPLALVLVEVSREEQQEGPPVSAKAWQHWLLNSYRPDEIRDVRTVLVSESRMGVLLPGCERLEATRWIGRAAEAYERETGEGIDAGVSAIAVVPKGFESGRLMTAARRCLDAAVATGSASVKSIEVY